ncbi:hypothetical protein [Hymenobacter sp. DG01]|uniref:hypothetical protein n=1 Tax=Hymenobacter sp. DG01 TaxID=2584940 RepID=UPI0011209012|nr:hypothetical protein [Hymenobacter sp. DG01]
MLLLPTPRRAQHPLLYPPGLLALAWLLLLGCVALPYIKHPKPKQTILEVAFPKPGKPIGSLFGFPTPQQVKEFGPWKSVFVLGNLWADYFEVRMIESICLSLVGEQIQHRAVHVYMSEPTSYNTFIQLLDIPNRLGIKKYWIDLRKPPFSINLLGNEPPDPGYAPFFCGTSSSIISQPEVAPKLSFSEAATEWFAERRNDLYSPDWRNTWRLLLLPSMLSGWQVVRQWRRAAAQNVSA